MSTSIDPEKFKSLTHTKYMKALLKDVRVLGRTKKMYDYIIAHPYKFGSKKASLFLFVDPDSKRWKSIAKAIKKKKEVLKYSTGTCKVVPVGDIDDDGDDDFTIAILKATGLRKNQVADIINDEMFKDDGDLQAVVGDEELSDSDLNDKRKDKEEQPELELEDVETFAKKAKLREKTGLSKKKSLMIPFVEALNKFFGSMEFDDIPSLVGEVKDQLSTLKSENDKYKDTEEYDTKVLPLARELQALISDKVEQLDVITKAGDKWMKKHSKLFWENLRGKTTVERQNKKKEATEKELIDAKKLLAWLIKMDAKLSIFKDSPQAFFFNGQPLKGKLAAYCGYYALSNYFGEKQDLKKIEQLAIKQLREFYPNDSTQMLKKHIIEDGLSMEAILLNEYGFTEDKDVDSGIKNTRFMVGFNQHWFTYIEDTNNIWWEYNSLASAPKRIGFDEPLKEYLKSKSIHTVYYKD